MSLAASRLLLIGFIATLTVVTFRSPRGFAQTLREFLLTPTTPKNLAVFRVVVFAVVLQKANVDYARWLSRIPPVLLSPPWGMSGLMQATPLDSTTVQYAGWLLTLVCVLGMAGVCSRTCAAIAAALGLYVLSVPQCVGKVGHYNHLIWFLGLLAVTPCGDALSVDALIHRRGKLPGFFGAHVLSPAYGYPLRVAALLIGVVYFFPGFWKVWESGLDWVMGDNLPNLVVRYGALDGIGRADWIVDFPVLLKAGGAGVLLFEMGFLFALFWPRVRPVAIAAGVAFHFGNWYVLDILFHPLLACYVVFVDWASFARRLGPKHIAGAKRDERPSSELANSPPGPVKLVSRAAVAVGIILISGALYTGARGITEGWPFACYPTFSEVAQPLVTDVSIESTNDEDTIPLDIEQLRERVGPVRWERWIIWMLDTQDGDVRSERLDAFVRWCSRETGLTGTAGELRLFEMVYEVRGTGKALVARELAFVSRVDRDPS